MISFDGKANDANLSLYALVLAESREITLLESAFTRVAQGHSPAFKHYASRLCPCTIRQI